MLDAFGFYPHGVQPFAALNGSMALVGAGSLAIAARRRTEAKAVFPGIGAFVARVRGPIQGQSVMTGAGDLDVAVSTMAVSGRFAFPGAGALAVKPTQTQQTRASLAGAGALAWPARVIDVAAGGSVMLSGTGGLAVRVIGALAIRSEHLDGVGNLKVGLLLEAAGRRLLAGAGALITRTIMTDIIQPGELSIPGQGSLRVGEYQYFVNRLNFLGVGNLTTRAPQIALRGRNWFQGVGDFDSRVSVRQPISPVAMAGEGDLAVSIDTRLWATRAAFAGAGKLVVRAGRVEIVATAAVFPGAGALTTRSGEALRVARSLFVGAGSLTTRADIDILRGAMSFRGVGFFLPAGQYSAGVVRLLGTGTFRAVAPPLRYAWFEFAGAGALTTRLLLRGALQPGFAGAGQLVVRGALRLPIRAALAGSGALTVQVRQLMRVRGAFQGAGKLTAGLTLTFGAKMFGQGLLVARGVERIRFATVWLRGSGSLTVISFRRFAARNEFRGTGTLVVRPRLRLPANVAFDGRGFMNARISILTGKASFTGAGHLDVSYFGGVRRRGAAALHGTGELVPVSEIYRRGRAALHGTGALIIFPGVVRAPNLLARFQGRGLLLSGGPLPTYYLRAAAASFNGVGRLTTRLPFRVVAGLSVFNGLGNFIVRNRWIGQMGAEFNGAGVLTTPVRLRLPVESFQLLGDGVLSITTLQRPAARVHLDGAGDLFSNVGPPLLWIVMPGQGELVAETWGSIWLAGTHLEGAGEWVPDIPGQIISSWEMAGEGKLEVLRSPIRRRSAVDWDGIGDLYVSEYSRFPLSARFAGTGDLDSVPVQAARARLHMAGAGGIWTDTDTLTTLLSRAVLQGAGGLKVTPVREGLMRNSFVGSGNLYWSDVNRLNAAPWLRGAGGLKVQSTTPIMGINPVFEGAGNLRVNARVYRWIGDVEMAGTGQLALDDLGKFFTARFTTTFEGEGTLHPVELLRRTFLGQPPRTLYTPRAPSGRVLKTARRSGTR